MTNPFSKMDTPQTWHLPVKYKELSKSEKFEVRNQYRRQQDDLCAYCGEPLSEPCAPKIKAKRLDLRRFPPGFLDHPVHLHHDHDTGLTLGAVHAYCNGVSFQYDGV